MSHHYEHIIIGSGPAGVQMAYFFERHGMDYIVLEKSAKSNAFFRYYPRHRRLISVNKVNCGNNDKFKNIENVLRFDWNSLLTSHEDQGDLMFRDFTEEYYPSADDLVNYMDRYIDKYNIQIQYNTNVSKCLKTEEMFEIYVDDALKYTCSRVYVASGLSPKTLEQPFTVSGRDKVFYYYHTMPLTPETYKNKKVLIIGGGNAAFETANFINDHCDQLSVVGADRFAWKTHYPGNIRSVNMKIIDSYYLKLKVNLDWTVGQYARVDDKFKQTVKSLMSGNIWQNYDVVIYCGGFQPSVGFLDASLKIKYDKNRFPITSPFFESTCKHLYFIGCLSQQHDYKHGTSAFIHGFRYNCRFLFEYITKSFTAMTFQNKKRIPDKVLSQLNKSSLLLHRFDYFGDYLLMFSTHWIYVQHIPLRLIDSWTHIQELFKILKIKEQPILITQCYLGYDKTNKFRDTFAQPQTGQPVRTRMSVFIHPIFKVFVPANETYNEVYDYHLPENAFNEFAGYQYHYQMLTSFIHLLDNFRTSPVDINVLKAYEETIQHRYCFFHEVQFMQQFLDVSV